MVSSVYKSITKVLASRLSEVLSDTIFKDQTALILGRQIFYVLLIDNEVVDDVRTQRKYSIVIKLVFEKAFDCISWHFLNEVMDGRGFGAR